MTNPPKFMLLLICLTFAGIAGCAFFGKEGMTRSMPVSDLSPLVIVPEPPDPAPDRTLYAPLFEEPSAVVPWARPVAPENSFNAQFTPDGQYLIYLARHPGTRHTSLYCVPFAGGEPVLLGTAGVEGEILYYHISPDSTRVIYYQPSNGHGLHSSAITGTKQIPLTDDNIAEAAISPDGQWIVYWGRDGVNGLALYSVPAAGGTPIWLGSGLQQSESYQITPDSRYVLFTAARQVGVAEPVELYRVPIQGGTPIQLSQGEQVRAGGKFLITPDSQKVIFGNLYVVAIDGGTPEQLNPMTDMGQPESQFTRPPQLSPDGQWLVFVAGDMQDNHMSLYSVPLAGGSTVQLNRPLADEENVKGFGISPDGERVLYWQGKRGEERNLPLYSVPIAGGKPITLPAWDWFHQSADSRWIVYGVRLENGGFDIYSISTKGGVPTQLNTTVPTNSAAASTMISPDSRTVFYATSKDAGGGMPVFDGLYAVPIDGGEGREMTGVDGQDRVFAFFSAPDNQTVIVDADYDGDRRFALYAVTLAVLTTPQE